MAHQTAKAAKKPAINIADRLKELSEEPSKRQVARVGRAFAAARAIRCRDLGITGRADPQYSIIHSLGHSVMKEGTTSM